LAIGFFAPSTQALRESAKMAATIACAYFIRVPRSDRNRQANEEGRAFTRFAGEIDCTIV
jgi:hypothetical protein